MLTNNSLRFLLDHYPLYRGKGWLHRFVSRRLHGLTLSRDKFDNLFLLDLDNFIDCRQFLSGAFEEENLLLLDEYSRRFSCCTFLDIGANLGIYSVFFAAKPYINRVHAFEPDPRNYAQLQANLFINNLYNVVRAHPIGLSNINGSTPFFVSRKSGSEGEYGKNNAGVSSLTFRGHRHNSEEAVTITTQRLDDFFNQPAMKSESGETSPVSVKIDVEGHELAVLEGMEQYLKNHDCVVLIECQAGSLPNVEELFKRMNYQLTHSLRNDYIFIKNTLIESAAA